MGIYEVDEAFISRGVGLVKEAYIRAEYLVDGFLGVETLIVTVHGVGLGKQMVSSIYRGLS